MSIDIKLLICSLIWTSSDTTGHDTGLGTGLSLAGGSGDCFNFAAAFSFDGMTDLPKVVEIMIFGVIIWQTVDDNHQLCTFVGGCDAIVALPV